MDISELVYVQRKLESHNGCANLLLIVDNKISCWVDADTFVEHETFKDFMTDWCEMEEELAERVSKLPMRFAQGDGLVAPFVVDGHFKQLDFEEASSVAGHTSEAAVLAAMELEIPMNEVEDSYFGHWASFEDFVEDHFYESRGGDLIPKEFRCYIDVSKIAEDWKQSGDYICQNGHVFESR